MIRTSSIFLFSIDRALARKLFLSILGIWLIPSFLAAEPGILHIGGDIDYRPYSFIDESGDPAGFDIEVARLLADRLGLESDIHLAPWHDILNELRTDDLDIVVGTLFTISRTDEFIFTDPYNTDSISIFVRTDSPIDSLRKLEGEVIATMRGDAIPEKILNTNGVSSTVESYDTLTGALRGVSRGTADYTLIPYAVGMELLEQTGIDNIHVVGPPVHTIQYRLAVHRSNRGFRDQLNSELNALIETNAFKELQDKWLRHYRTEISLEAAIRYIAPAGVPIVAILLITWVWTLKRQIHRQTQELEARNEELVELAMRDNLTGLTNRRLFDTIVGNEFLRSRRDGSVFSLVFMDIDHFKSVNDTYGHAAGDSILQEFSRRAALELREYDILARYGGEEFVVFLRDTAYDTALGIAGRIHDRCRTERFNLGGEDAPVAVTVSIGVASVTQDDASFRVVLQRADEAMYQAKHDGRDRVTGYRSNPEERLPDAVDM